MNCDDYSDELHCNVTETMRNATNTTMSPNNTSPQATTAGNLTISAPTPLNNHNESTKPSSAKKRKKDKSVKNKRKNTHNNTKRKNNSPFDHKTLTSSPNKASTTAMNKITSHVVKTKNVEASTVTHCSVEECVKWKSCWRDVKRSHECVCGEAACRRSWKTSAHVGNKSDRRLKDVFEWVIISILSTGLIMAIIILLLKQRRLRRNKLSVHTVVCYHHSQVESVRCKDAAESRPLYDKAGYPSLLAGDEGGNVCYIGFTGQVKRKGKERNGKRREEFDLVGNIRMSYRN
ncbi:uncharacterized protein LOC144632245 [Oculina patagonica]